MILKSLQCKKSFLTIYFLFSNSIGRFQKPSIGKIKIPSRATCSDHYLAIGGREIAIGTKIFLDSKSYRGIFPYREKN